MSQRTPPDPFWQASVTWDSIVKIKEYVGLPLILKGIANREDAKLAVDHGVDVVWVSNHGGRQLDHGLGTMDFLEEVVDAVEDKVEIVLDGGIQRGSDVIKAVAMGAKAVALGKLQGWGLAANGSSGVYRVLEILEGEIRVGMGLLGVTNVYQLIKSFVCLINSLVIFVLLLTIRICGSKSFICFATKLGLGNISDMSLIIILRLYVILNPYFLDTKSTYMLK